MQQLIHESCDLILGDKHVLHQFADYLAYCISKTWGNPENRFGSAYAVTNGFDKGFIGKGLWSYGVYNCIVIIFTEIYCESSEIFHLYWLHSVTAITENRKNG